MTRKLFGTDGVRGTANTHPMTTDVILRLAQAAGQEFMRGDHRHLVVIGKDTRLSGYMLEPALTAGFISMGMDVVLLGPLPTPAVAMLTRSLRADLGVMISASHNPYHDNGIKLFGPNGYKLEDEVEQRIEERFLNPSTIKLADPFHLGKARRLEDAAGRYIEFIKSTFPRRLRLDGLKIVLDCAHGAAYKVGPSILWELGAEVIPIGVEPDGCNINNECGATSPLALREAVLEHQADIGIALDGDADRILVCDEKGSLLDGDQILASIAKWWQKEGLLEGQGLVTTVMSNLALEHFLKDQGLTLERTQVGDRYVVEQMRAQGFNLGGEQSGHLVIGNYSTTGDGLIAALQILAILVQAEKPASEALFTFNPFPQVLRNIPLSREKAFDFEALTLPQAKALQKLGTKGRVLIRKSGTEPLLRIMAEGEDLNLVQEVIQDLADSIDGVSQKAS